MRSACGRAEARTSRSDTLHSMKLSLCKKLGSFPQTPRIPIDLTLDLLDLAKSVLDCCSYLLLEMIKPSKKCKNKFIIFPSYIYTETLFCF
jgi:hypothetical protein